MAATLRYAPAVVVGSFAMAGVAHLAYPAPFLELMRGLPDRPGMRHHRSMPTDESLVTVWLSVVPPGLGGPVLGPAGWSITVAGGLARWPRLTVPFTSPTTTVEDAQHAAAALLGVPADAAWRPGPIASHRVDVPARAVSRLWPGYADHVA